LVEVLDLQNLQLRDKHQMVVLVVVVVAIRELGELARLAKETTVVPRHFQVMAVAVVLVLQAVMEIPQME
jgi:hypothetical protein